jgi:hypothetical protein
MDKIVTQNSSSSKEEEFAFIDANKCLKKMIEIKE